MQQSEIYLILPASLNQGVLNLLDMTLQRYKISCIMLQTGHKSPQDQTFMKNFVELAQNNNIACLIENDHELAKLLNADGIHLSQKEQVSLESEEHEIEKAINNYENLRSEQGEDFIIGYSATDRHMAMTIGN